MNYLVFCFSEAQSRKKQILPHCFLILICSRTGEAQGLSACLILNRETKKKTPDQMVFAYSDYFQQITLLITDVSNCLLFWGMLRIFNKITF